MPEVEINGIPGTIYDMPMDFELYARVTAPGTRLEEGTSLRFQIRASRECRIFLISHDCSGDVALIFPCEEGNDNLVFPSVEAKFPGVGSTQYNFMVEPPFGRETILVLAFGSTAKCDFAKDIEAACSSGGAKDIGTFENDLITRFREKHPKQKDVPWACAALQFTTLPKESNQA